MRQAGRNQVENEGEEMREELRKREEQRRMDSDLKKKEFSCLKITENTKPSTTSTIVICFMSIQTPSVTCYLKAGS